MFDTLAVEVERDGATQNLELDVSRLEEAETVKIVALCGWPAFYELSRGVWNMDAANALIYVKLYNPGDKWSNPEAPPYDGFSVDWSRLGIVETDPEMEAELAGMSDDR